MSEMSEIYGLAVDAAERMLQLCAFTGQHASLTIWDYEIDAVFGRPDVMATELPGMVQLDASGDASDIFDQTDKGVGGGVYLLLAQAHNATREEWMRALTNFIANEVVASGGGVEMTFGFIPEYDHDGDRQGSALVAWSND